jgi:hypothetical protein
MGKAIKNTLLAAIITAVLCAGTVSARQLRSGVNGFTTPACGGTCSLTRPCAVAGCVCSFTTPTTAFCTTKLAGVVPLKK